MSQSAQSVENTCSNEQLKRTLEHNDNQPDAKTPKLHQYDSPRILSIVDYNLSKFTKMIDALFTKMDTSESLLRNLNSKLSEVSDDVAVLRSKVATLEAIIPEVKTVQQEVSLIKPEINEIKGEVETLKDKVRYYENVAVAGDLLLQGIPALKDEKKGIKNQTSHRAISLPHTLQD